MNLTEIFLIVVIFLNLYWGWKDGLLKKLLKVIFLIGAIFITIQYSSELGSQYFSWLTTNSSVKGILVFISVCIILTIIQNILLITIFKPFSDNSLNRILGVILGAVQSVVVISIFVAVMEFLFSYSIQELQTKSSILNFLISNNLLFNNEIAKIFSVIKL